eukprot:1165531-Rhodomonas_salina.1
MAAARWTPLRNARVAHQLMSRAPPTPPAVVPAVVPALRFGHRRASTPRGRLTGSPPAPLGAACALKVGAVRVGPRTQEPAPRRSSLRQCNTDCTSPSSAVLAGRAFGAARIHTRVTERARGKHRQASCSLGRADMIRSMLGRRGWPTSGTSSASTATTMSKPASCACARAVACPCVSLE